MDVGEMGQLVAGFRKKVEEMGQLVAGSRKKVEVVREIEQRVSYLLSSVGK